MLTKLNILIHLAVAKFGAKQTHKSLSSTKARKCMPESFHVLSNAIVSHCDSQLFHQSSYHKQR